MSQWGAKKARLVLAALLQIGWRLKRQAGGAQRGQKIHPQLLREENSRRPGRWAIAVPGTGTLR